MSKILNESNSQQDTSESMKKIIVSNMSKILNESNSQHLTYNLLNGQNCFQYVKDTKWKQFTTVSLLVVGLFTLFPICQRY